MSFKFKLYMASESLSPCHGSKFEEASSEFNNPSGGFKLKIANHHDEQQLLVGRVLVHIL